MAKISQAKRRRLKRQREKAEEAAKLVVEGSGSSLDPSSRKDAVLIEKAVTGGWLDPEDIQRFETRTSLEELQTRIKAAPAKASMMDLVALSVLGGLNDKDKRRRGIAERTAVAMERANQRDEQHAEDLKIKQALLEAKGGHTDESIPTGVVIFERPSVSIEDWQAEQARAAAEQAAEESET